MKKLATLEFGIILVNLVLLGCETQGPGADQLSREALQQREAERQQAEFRKTLPPVTNPGQGQ